MSRLTLAFGAVSFACTVNGSAVRGDPPAQPGDEPRTVALELKVEPRVVRGIAQRYGEILAERYELTPQQREHIEAALSRRLLTEAVKHQQACQAVMEATMTSLLTSGGQWTPAVAKDFGRRIQPALPAMRTSIGKLAEEIRGEMTLAQKARFTADFAAFSAGYAVFESRMKKWSEGKVGDNPNLFWVDESEDPPTTRPDGKIESRDVARARLDAQQMMKWSVSGRSEQWADYIERVRKCYGFTDQQMESARAILKDTRVRFAALSTPERLREIEDAELIPRVLWGSKRDELRGSPYVQELARRASELRQPFDNLDTEFRRRINELADSAQRARHAEAVVTELRELGYDGPVR